MTMTNKLLTLLFSFMLISTSWTLPTETKHRSKRDAFDIILKKKGLSAAATALIAATSISKKKFLPVPIPFPIP